MSKYFLNPTLVVVVFVLGVIISLSLGFGFLPVIMGLVFITLLLAVRKIYKYATLIIVFALGSTYALSFIYFTSVDMPSEGCLVGTVVSHVNSYSADKSRFLFVNGGSRIVVESNDAQELGYGDRLKVCLTSENVKVLDPGRDKYYLSNYLSRNVISSPEIEYEKRGRGVRRSLYDFSDYLGKRFYRLWPGDRGVLARGLILGGAQDFTEDIAVALKNSGTSHLTAVSGYNIAIITVVLFNLLRLRSKKLALVLTAVILITFVFLTGLTPSVVRAALMGGAYLLAKLLGRPRTTLHFLMLAGLILILSNPFILYNVGFLLSFVATYGLILAGGVTSGIVGKREGATEVVFGTLGETLVAQIFVMPILLYYFGQISIIAPLSNLLVLPIIPLAMLLEFIAILVSFINFNVAILVAVLIDPVLQYILFIIRLLGTTQWSVVKIESVNLAVVAGFYLLLHSVLYFVNRFIRKDFDKIKT